MDRQTPPAVGQTLASLFVNRCREQPDAVAYAFVRDTLEIADLVTWGELQRQVAALGEILADCTKSGDRVLLVYPPGIEFVKAFWACMLTGRIAVPVPAPDHTRLKNSLPRLRTIVRDASASLLLTTAELSQAIQSLQGESSDALQVRAIDPLLQAQRELPDVQGVQPDTIAYLQYTSGSTSAPRGVELSHRSVIAHCEGGCQAQAIDRDSRVLNWLPHHHDFGLVLGVIGSVCSGATAYLMSPLVFLRRPLRWLEAIERFGITHTGGPNFALAACVRSARQQLDWKGNLATLKALICGAEPIQMSTVEGFSTLFAPWGLAEGAVLPSYGMAEAVLGITTARPGQVPHARVVASAALAEHRVQSPVGAEAVRRIVGCGYPIDGLTVAIVDPNTRMVCDPDSVGEIWVRGASVGQGYWAQPDASQATFQSFLATGEGPWLRTGDLGFKQDDELFVTGRLKDMIIMRGRNLYPQDLEVTAQAVDKSLRPGYGATFSVDSDGEESVVLVQELERRNADRNLGQLTGAIRRAIADQHELSLKAIVLVRTGTLPRTSSGKIMRRACRQHYLDGTLEVLFTDDCQTSAYAYENLTGATEQALAAIWSDVLRREGIGRRDRFIDLGGHSLMATQMVSRVRIKFGVELPLARVFEHVTLADVASEIDRLRAAGEFAPGDGKTEIPIVDRVGPLPASYSQRRMWLVQNMNPETTAYNMPFLFRVRASVDPVVMEATIDRVARHHEAFRTRFVACDGEPMQCIEDYRFVSLEVLRLDDLPADVRDERARSLLQERIQHRFDLSDQSLHRPTLIRLGENDHLFLWVIHHAVGDLWSFVVLLRDLANTYDALTQHGEVELPRQRIEYADYAAWQRHPDRGPEFESQMAYWRQRLQGLSTLTLPADRQRRVAPTGRGGRVTTTLSAESITAIKQFSRFHGVTPFMMLLGCFDVLLARYCAQEDVAVGVPIANRHRFESEHLVGTLVNTLVVRTDLSGNPSFAELLGRVRERVVEAYANQEASFELLVEEMKVERDLSMSPLVQVMFNVVNAPFDVLNFAGKRIEPFDFDRGAAQFDLAMTVDTEVFGQIHLEYASDLFARSSAERMLRSYLWLIEQAMADADRNIGDCAVLSPCEQAELEDLNATRSRYPDQQCVHDLLSLQAGHAPDRVALMQPGVGQATYGELESRSNRLAHALRARGIGRGALVGLCVERGPAMVIAQLAILKAGAAYVPLDPAYPSDRLAYMAEDARLALLVSESALLSAVGWPREQCLLLDADGASIDAQPDKALPADEQRDARPEDAAYVIYTSGSTGKPKGVVVPHGAVVNFLVSMANEPGLSQDDTLVAVTTLSFDIAVLELLLPLSVGAKVVLATGDQALDGQQLRRLIEENRVNVMQATPSTWRILIDSGWQGSASFKALIGGEGLPQDLAIQLLARTGELWNMYGPTETTVWSTCWKVAPSEDGISIGKPIANTTIHVLDERQRLCPIGVSGEIYIGGAGVTLGYLNRPELTAERFIADPFSPGGRLYRTGDRGRWRHDGLLEHMGRLDFQVKVRGYRIELGEIESTLLSHPQVARAVVIVREDVPGDVRLVAYLVVRDQMPDLQSLRHHLRASLPEYMVPQLFVEIESIPLLPNGKINRQELPVPTESVSIHAEHGEGPRTAAEHAVAEVWQRLLGISGVGITDNFFELGGHSLLAMRVVTELNQRFGTTIAVRDIVFESLSQIAARISTTE